VPTYQYACTDSACGHRFEAVQSFSDSPLTTCPVCESRLRKVFSPVGVLFKGSGFYRTDSREAAKNGSKRAKDAGSEKKTESAVGTSASSSSGSRSGSESGSGSSGSASGSTSKAAAS
jgi:putative FmdB family regulatory protein